MSDSFEHVFGLNLLDNITTGMYTDSLTLYREYVQNACDAIDEAVKNRLLAPGKGVIDINIDVQKREVTIRDNGTGIAANAFVDTMKKIADSGKTYGEARGFRGIGRLIGIAYCDALEFTTRAEGENVVSFLRYDAKKWKEILDQNRRHTGEKLTLSEFLTSVTTYRRYEADPGDEERWFEVKLVNVSAENHEILDRQRVIDYLSFVAPTPFSSNFDFSNKIHEHAKSIGFQLNEYEIRIDGQPIFKEYRTFVSTSKGEKKITDVEFKEFKDDSGNIIAWMWYGLRDFQAVINNKKSPCRGIRLRKENIQFGGEDALQKLFSEDRGSHYYIGEVHVVSNDLIPNSRRDYFSESRALEIFERELRGYFQDTLYDNYHTGNDVSSSVDKVLEYKRKKEEFHDKVCNGDFNDEEHRKLAEDELNKSESVAQDAQKKIDRILNRKREKGGENSPTYKIAASIVSERLSGRTTDERSEYGVQPADRANASPIDNVRGASNVVESSKQTPKKFWADRLTSLTQKEKDVVSRVLNVVIRHVDEETLGKIRDDLEREFK